MSKGKLAFGRLLDKMVAKTPVPAIKIEIHWPCSNAFVNGDKGNTLHASFSQDITLNGRLVFGQPINVLFAVLCIAHPQFLPSFIVFRPCREQD